MAKKEIIAFDPPTEEEIMLIQPNNVTFGQYNVSEWQENLLTLIGVTMIWLVPFILCMLVMTEPPVVSISFFILG